MPSRITFTALFAVALPVPAVYCDVVVTERQWAHRMRQGKVDVRYGTKLLSDTADLVEVLVNAPGSTG